jgi:DNA-binding transcriptional LysR family regulator
LVYSNRAYSTPLKLPDAALKKSAGQSEKETVRLVCLNSFGPFFLPGLLSEIQAAEPDFVVEVLEGDQAEAIDAIAGQDAEFGLVYDRHLPDYLANTKLATLEPYVLLPEGHHLASSEKIALAALVDEPMVLLDAPLSREYFLSLFEDAQLEPRIGMKTTSFEMVRSLVGNGAGYALLVTKPANMVSYDGKPLVARPVADNVAPISIVLAQRAGEPMSEGAERAAAHCIRYFGKA